VGCYETGGMGGKEGGRGWGWGKGRGTDSLTSWSWPGRTCVGWDDVSYPGWEEEKDDGIARKRKRTHDGE